MQHIYRDNLEGFFAIATASEWLGRNQHQAFSHYTILMNFGGPMTITKDLQCYRLEKGEITFFTPGTFISDLEPSDDHHCLVDFNQQFYCLELHDKDLSCNGLLFGAMPDEIVLSTPEDQAHNNRHLVEIFQNEFKQDDATQGEMLKLLLKRLIIKCARLAKQQLFQDENAPVQDTDLFRQFQALVEKHFRRHHKVSDYADLMHKSPKTISNTFNQLAVQSPIKIIRARIVLEAKRLLHYSDKSVKEIAYELGFSEPGQFSRMFKELATVSPSEFQAQRVN